MAAPVGNGLAGFGRLAAEEVGCELRDTGSCWPSRCAGLLNRLEGGAKEVLAELLEPLQVREV